MSQAWLRKLPLGGYSETADEAQAEWRKLHKKLEAYFPGWRVSGWDPSIRLVKYDSRGYGNYIDVTPEAAVALRSPSDEDYWWVDFRWFWNSLGNHYRFDNPTIASQL